MDSNKPYKRATSLQSLSRKYHCVASRDTFLRFFFSYIYVIFNDTNEPDVDTDISVALSYVDNFIGDPNQDPSTMVNIKGAVEKFAKYIVDNFLLPRTSIFYVQFFGFYC
ncbi:uncharacterized protein EURHEDRAFT_415869 [Aspergillus ruber CBS 135680]|uniref:Uncharacterized protein n=1 Tax=Aspergillus ruber (strain CBS 135680) TaxID=1388766 RepID=A0A017S6B3_ASPRC|nr:uncharacterized protein EURHEDRAFT_415869 [Aspergillus ruber CBS 135680]EYE92164.1 hypothetical protein EURHEDRAFT_415869 [Aspergillus ruber CBS 135680]